MEEENALANAPERRGAEFIGTRRALRDVIGQTRPMLCTSKSENSAACWLASPGVKFDGPVCSVGVWQAAQPI